MIIFSNSKKLKVNLSFCQVILIIIIFFCDIPVSASPFRFTSITTDNGLTNNTINVIYKDSMGFIWLGTQNGLNRFDGINIESYQDFNNETIFAICETDSENLWVGTNFGLKLLNRKTGHTQSIDLKESAIIRYFLFFNNTLYICSDKGLFIRKGNEIKKSEIEIKQLTGIAIDNNGNYWMSSSDGLIFHNPANLETEKFLYSETTHVHNKFNCLSIINSDIIIGSENAGLLVFDGKTKSINRFMDIGNECVMNLNHDENYLYAGTNGSGMKIISLNDKTITTLDHDVDDPYSVSSNAVYSFLLDNGMYWIGTYLSGLNYISNSTDFFKIYSSPGKLNTQDLNVRSFWIGETQSENKCNLIGTRNGFYYISETVFRKFSTGNTSTLKSNIILNIFPWKRLFLIGTYNSGLYVFNPQTMSLSEFSNDQLFKNNSFYDFTTDNEGCIWFATLSGVISYNVTSGIINNFTIDNSDLPDNFVFSILHDSKNRIWIGTSEGLCVYNPETKLISNNFLPHHPKIDFKMIRHISEDSSGNIWICSEKNGLLQIKNDLSFYNHYTDKNLLPDIYAINTIEDLYGYIWITTSKGVVRLDKKTGDYVMFSMNDGIPAPMFNPVVQIDDNGTIWWANEKGLLYVLPSGELENTNNTPLVISGIYIGGKRIEPNSNSLKENPEFARKIIISPKDDTFSIRFTDLEYSYYKSGIYEYKLSGIDENWNLLIGQNHIVYSGLHPGNYELQIRKAGSLNPVKSIIIIKSRSYSLYLWFGMTIVIILIGIYLYRIQFIKFKNQENAVAGNLKKRTKESKYQSSRLEENKAISIQNTLLEYMEKGQPYLSSKLKLADVSTAIKYPQAEISQVLNLKLETNFADFINNYRVKHFIKKARKGALQHYTLAALSEECGFNSRSSFFHVFKKITGQTPAEFLKEAGILMEEEE